MTTIGLGDGKTEHVYFHSFECLNKPSQLPENKFYCRRSGVVLVQRPKKQNPFSQKQNCNLQCFFHKENTKYESKR